MLTRPEWFQSTQSNHGDAQNGATRQRRSTHRGRSRTSAPTESGNETADSRSARIATGAAPAVRPALPSRTESASASANLTRRPASRPIPCGGVVDHRQCCTNSVILSPGSAHQHLRRRRGYVCSEVDRGVVSGQGASQARDVKEIGLDGRSAKLAEKMAVVSRSRERSNRDRRISAASLVSCVEEGMAARSRLSATGGRPRTRVPRRIRPRPRFVR